MTEGSTTKGSMTQAPLKQAGSAVIWKAVQMVGVKGIFTLRPAGAGVAANAR